MVLLSGGLDSVYNLYAAHKAWGGQVLAVHFHYGQRAHEQEHQAAQFFTSQLDIPLHYVDVAHLFQEGSSALTQHSRELPTQEVNIESLEVSQNTARQVWVPNRNGILLNIAAGFAESHNIPYIVPGFNKEEAETFPDNSVDFIEAINHSLKFSTANQVQVKCFSQDLAKPEIFAACVSLGVEIDKIWPCYQDQTNPCGRCESCQRFERARKDWDNHGGE